jgi:alpha-tubulin suppressor-like RCC1 family protein
MVYRYNIHFREIGLPQRLYARLHKTRAICSYGTVLDVKAGDGHAIILTTEGVFAHGRNSAGELGFPRGSPSVLDSMVKVCASAIAIGCGASHTVILLANHRILGCGSDGWGQLGGQQPNIAYGFRQILVSDAISIACGHSFTMVLTAKHDVYIFGSDSHPKTTGYKVEWHATRIYALSESAHIKTTARIWKRMEQIDNTWGESRPQCDSDDDSRNDAGLDLSMRQEPLNDDQQNKLTKHDRPSGELDPFIHLSRKEQMIMREIYQTKNFPRESGTITGIVSHFKQLLLIGTDGVFMSTNDTNDTIWVRL